MATSSIFGQSRPAAFVVRRVAGKGKASYARSGKAVVRPCGPSQYMHMTKAEAAVFFAACEAPFQPEVNIFENLPEVALWFKK